MSDFNQKLEELQKANNELNRNEMLAKAAKAKLAGFIETAKQEREKLFKRHAEFIKDVTDNQGKAETEANADVELQFICGEQKAKLFLHRSEYVRRQSTATLTFLQEAIAEYETQINTAINAMATGDARAAQSLAELFEKPILIG